MSFDIATLDRTIARARSSGALMEITTERDWVVDQGFRFLVKWVPALASKHAVPSLCSKAIAANPFLPPEPQLLVGSVGQSHHLVLNKYPVLERHLLIVTRRYEDQTSPLTDQDFTALTQALRQLGGLAFYNGGPTAGASQPHKHLQWIPSLTEAPSLHGFTATLDHAPSLQALENPALPWRHAFVRHHSNSNTQPSPLRQAFEVACHHAGINPSSDPMPPYNLLADPQWLLVVPRSRECHDGISINSLGYAGSLFVRRPEQLELVRSLGPLQLLAATGFTRAPQKP